MSTVILHVGAFKTGTSFIQTVLTNNRDTLAADGVLWAGGHWREQVQATKGLLASTERGLADWMALVHNIDAWQGPIALVSMEELSIVTEDMAQTAVESLAQHRVRVVLTVRDLGRVFPAQWQESIQNKCTWSYQEYIDGAILGDRKQSRARRHFWNKHDAPKVLRTWASAVPLEDIVVVTVPPAGAPRGLLWERFCEAAGLEPTRYDSSARVNESLGAASAETIRYVSMALDAGDYPARTQRVLKKYLAKQILAPRKSVEPVLVLPPEHEEWASRESERIVREIREVGPKIVGDLADLTPQFAPAGGPSTTDPSSLPVSELMAAAAHGLVGLCAEVAVNDKAQRRT